MATVAVQCLYCYSDEIYRHGLNPTQRGSLRYQYCRQPTAMKRCC
ncbi:IS1 family transposase [Edwardsiella ictaluri]|nr:hypothetical protein [Edwardsiella ictaluri]EKS7769870.1 hypothetical protein [Edwardsiella ictaluri]EKS7772923.1 hypothetical protein [Edwardsiella ictaluri]EKS7776469.1 hypothetical protein [Edwardsiella ictaluri]EKS7786597.1 hypothetical protein [Edwardsiella ictaluri]